MIAYFILGFLLVLVIHTLITDMSHDTGPDPFNDNDWVDGDDYIEDDK